MRNKNLSRFKTTFVFPEEDENSTLAKMMAPTALAGCVPLGNLPPAWTHDKKRLAAYIGLEGQVL